MINKDCKYFIGDKPCTFHKKEGVKCNNCNHYIPISVNILVIKFDALGDVLRTTCILPALKEKYPNCMIYWLTKKNAKEIFLENPYIDELLFIEDNFTLPRLLSINFYAAFNPDASINSASILQIINSEVKFGFVANSNGKVISTNKSAENWLEAGVFDDIKKTNVKTYQEILYEICGLHYKCQEIVLKLNEYEIKFGKEFLKSNSMNNYKYLVGVNTGASKRWKLKQWHTEKYIKLINKLNLEHPEIGIIIFGGDNENEKNEYIKKSTKNVVVAKTNNSLRDFFSLINVVNVMITGDTLALHVATALKKKTICYFGPTSSNEIESYNNRVIKILPKLDCLCCYKNSCDYIPSCMDKIEVDDIYNALLIELNNSLSN